jgi:hypothetical protein
MRPNTKLSAGLQMCIVALVFVAAATMPATAAQSSDDSQSRPSPRDVTKDRYIKGFDPAVLAAMKSLETRLDTLDDSAARVQQVNQADVVSC